MKKIPLFALALMLWSGVAAAEGLSISVSSEDSRTSMGPRRNVRNAQLAIQSRDGSTVLMLTDGVVAMQLTDKVIDEVEPDEDANFLEELLSAGVRIAVGKSVEYPVASIRGIDYRDGALRITNDRNEPVFTNVKVNGTEILRNFARADAERFAKAVRAAKR